MLYYIAWALYAIFAAAVCFYIPFWSIHVSMHENGKTDGLWCSGYTSFTALIIINHITVAMQQRGFTIVNVTLTIVSFLLFMPCIVLLNNGLSTSINRGAMFNEYMRLP